MNYKAVPSIKGGNCDTRVTFLIDLFKKVYPTPTRTIETYEIIFTWSILNEFFDDICVFPG